jgi:glutamate-ammonia-ligase adenylyltransferase
MAVLAMGKLGGRELTGESDLDLIFVYDYPDPDAVSGGARGLPAQQYYSRLSQRLINALTVPTAEGKLYEVDMRLRPSGNSGPVATRFDGFGDYQRNEAWIWEHMALTRGRVIAGEGGLMDRVEGVIAEVLCRPRDRATVALAVLEMRQRLVKEAGRGNVNPWELKLVRGGLLDIEFIAQFLQLAHGAEDGGVLAPNTALALSNLARLGHLSRRDADELIAASSLYRDLMALFRVAVVGEFNPATAPRGLANAVLKMTGSDDMSLLERHLVRIQADVLSIFHSTIEASAASGPSNA